MKTVFALLKIANQIISPHFLMSHSKCITSKRDLIGYRVSSQMQLIGVTKY